MAMRRPVVAALIAGLLAAAPVAAAAAPAPAPGVDPGHPLRGIKGADDRIQVDARAYPWSAIGRLTKGDGSLCTAVMIGPATALTAAHCVWNGRTGAWMPARAVFLTLGWEYGEWSAASQVARIETPPDARGPQPDASLASLAGDWAVLHLASPVGRQTGWLGVAPLSADTYPALAARGPVVLQAGYSMDRRHVLTGHVGCRIHGWVADGVVAHDCDATRGDSGSPLFTWIDGRFQVLGTHVSSFSNGQRVFGAAVTGPGLGEGWAAEAPSGGASPWDDDLMAVVSRSNAVRGGP